MMQKRLVPFVVAVLSVIAAVVRVEAHAFLVRAEPRVGSTVNKVPTEVRVWFSETVQAGVSSIHVFDMSGKQVDKKDAHSDRANRAVLCVSLIPALTPGSRTHRHPGTVAILRWFWLPESRTVDANSA